MSFPCTGDANITPCICAPDGWEEYHNYVWPEFWNYEGKIKWLTLEFFIIPPLDKLITADLFREAWGKVFVEQLREGGALRMCFMNRADRELGIPVLWHYQVYLEFHESPLIQITAAMGALGVILLALIGVGLTLKLVNSGIIEKIGSNIIVPSIVGLGMVFILGIGFIFVLANYMPGIRATARPPKVPGAGISPIGEVSVGPAPTAARRR